MQVLRDNQKQGDPFDIQAVSFVRLEGTLSATTWNIQSKRRGVPVAMSPWQDEFETPISQNFNKSPNIQGAPELEYRVDIGTNDVGPIAFVYEAKQEIFK